MLLHHIWATGIDSPNPHNYAFYTENQRACYSWCLRAQTENQMMRPPRLHVKKNDFTTWLAYLTRNSPRMTFLKQLYRWKHLSVTDLGVFKVVTDSGEQGCETGGITLQGPAAMFLLRLKSVSLQGETVKRIASIQARAAKCGNTGF